MFRLRSRTNRGQNRQNENLFETYADFGAGTDRGVAVGRVCVGAFGVPAVSGADASNWYIFRRAINAALP